MGKESKENIYNISSDETILKQKLKIGERIKSLRKEYDFTQKQLADMLNYGHTAISNYETGKNEPSIADLIKLSEIFQVSVDYLLCKTNIKNPYLSTESLEIFNEFKSYFIGSPIRRQRLLRDFMQIFINEGKNYDIDDEMDNISVKHLKVAEDREEYQTKKSNN